MDLTFEKGDAQRPRGHAVVYFRVDTEPDKVYASYMVVLPVRGGLREVRAAFPGLAPGQSAPERLFILCHAAGAGGGEQL